MPRFRLVGLGIVAVMDDQPYACTVCSITFAQEMMLCGQWAHQVAQARPPLLQGGGGCTHTKEEKEEVEVKAKDMKPPEVIWGNVTHRSGSPRDALGEEQSDRSLVM